MIGNRTSKTETITIDRTGPLITASDIAWTNAASVTVSASATDALSGVNAAGWQYSVDGGAWSAVGNANNSVAISAEAAHTVSFRAKDAVGNISEKTVNVRIDRTSPVVAAADMPWTNAANVTVSAGASDSLSGVNTAAWQYKIDSGAWSAAGSANNKVSVTTEGVHTVSFQVRDIAGNLGSKSAAVRIDRTGPVITASDVSWTNAANVTVSASATDALSGLNGAGWQCSVDGGAWSAEGSANNSVTISGENAHTVSFRAKDAIGNSTEKTVNVRIDRTLPVVTASDVAWTNAASVTVSASATDSLSSVNPATWQHRIDSGAWSAAGSANRTATVTAEGVHTISFQVRDNAGNLGTKTSTVNIDRTGPAVGTVSVLANGINYAAESYLPTSTPVLRIVKAASDRTGTVSPIDKYEYLVRRSKATLAGAFSEGTATTFDIPSAQEMDESFDYTFSIDTPGSLADGVNYVYLRAVDTAGNTGTPIERVVRTDTALPSAVSIKSSTHPAADKIEDAVSASTAVFSLSAMTAGALGVASFEWELRVAGATGEGQAATADGEAVSGTVSIPRIELPNLADNEENEFYLLRVRALGGNGIRGPYSEYRFRVDTKPPSAFTLRVQPQAQGDLWYGDKSATLLWRRPIDLTGIKNYRYRVSTSEIADAVSSDITDAAWYTYPTPNDESASAAVSLSALVKNDTLKSGTAYAYVVCEDLAGNKQAAFASFKYDLDPPVVYGIEAKSDATTSAVQIDSIGTIGDGDGSGIASRETQLLEYVNENGSWKTYERTAYASLDDDASSDSYSGLSDGAYSIRLRVRDNAGNEKVVCSSSASLGGVEPPQQVTESFEVLANSFVIRGSADRTLGNGEWDFSTATVTLEIPQTYPLERQNLDGTWIPVTELVPIAVEAVAGGAPESATLTFSGAYRFGFGGFTLVGTDPTFSAVSGFTWSSIAVAPADSATALTYAAADGICVGLPPDEAFTACPELSHGASFSVGVKGSASATSPAWRLSGIDGQTASTLAGSYWKLRESRLRDIGASANGFFQVNTVALETAEVDGRSVLINGIVTPDTAVTLGGVEMTIEEAYVEGDKLKVKHAYIPLKGSGYSDQDDDQRIALRNLIIASDGTVTRPIKDYWSEPFSYAVALPGGTMTVSVGTGSVDFITNGSGGYVPTIASATASLPGLASHLSVSGLAFNAEGLAFDGSASVASFAGLIHGYTVTSSSAKLGSSGISLGSAELSLTPYTDEPVMLSGLVLSYDGYGSVGYAVESAGSWSSGTARSLSAPDYGSGIGVRAVRVDASGVWGTIDARLPSVLGSVVASFPRTPLPKTGSYGTSAVVSSVPVLPAGFSGSLLDAYFDGSAVRASALDVALIEGSSGLTVRYDDPSANSGGWVSGLSPETRQEAMVAYKGWSHELTTFVLGASSITCPDAKLTLPESLGGYSLDLSGAGFSAPGAFISGTVAADGYALVGGWFADLEGAVINGAANLYDAQARVPMYPSMGEGSFVFPSLSLTPAGSVLSCGTGTSELPFVSENGFAVTAREYRIADGGITSGGTISFPSAFGEDTKAAYSAGEIRVNADGSVETDRKDTNPVIFAIGGLDMKAEGYSFAREGLTVDIPTATVTKGSVDVSFVLPETSFYSDGEIRSGGKLVEGKEIELFGFTFGITETRLTDDGLKLKSYIRLPDVLEGHELYFDQLTLHSDGSITTDAALDKYRFSVGGFEFDLRMIRFDPDEGFSIGEAVITLPETLESKTLRVSNLSISGNGDFSLGGLVADPFDLWGFTFYLNSLSIADSVVSFGGAVCLPSTFPSAIAGKTLDIDSFSYSMDTNEVVSFAVSIDDPLVFPLIGDWVVTAEGVSVQKKENRYILGVDRGTLDFPADFFGDDMQVKSAEIAGLKIDPMDGSFAFDSVTISDVSVKKFDCDFTLDTLTVSSDFDFRFSGKAVLPDKEACPSFLRGKTITVTTFEIHSDGSLGNIDGSLGGLSGTILGSCEASDVAVGFAKYGDDYYLSASAGKLILGSTFPEGVAGKELKLDALKLKLNGPSIEEFSATALGLEFDLFGQAHVESADLSLAKNQTSGDFEIGAANAKIALTGSGFPESIRNERVIVTAFKMNTAGELLAFDAGLSLSQSKTLFSGVTLEPLGSGSPASISAALNADKDAVEFSVAGLLRLGSSFPQGLAGTTCSINALRFDADGNLLEADAKASLSDVPMFGQLVLRGGTIAIEKKNSSDLTIGVAGRLKLPDNAPQGLAGKELVVSSFVVSASGTIVDLSASIAGPAASDAVNLFGGLSLQYWNISASQSGGYVDLSVTGDLVMPSTLPGALANSRLAISAFTFSSSNMAIAKFDATYRPGQGGIDFPVFAGITARLTTIHLTQSDFSMSGSLTIPSTFPQGFAGNTVTLDLIKVGWDGKLKAVQAGIAAVDVNLIGFPVALRNLSFGTDGIAVSSAMLTLPSSLGGDKLGVRNARFDTNGNFSGEFVSPTIKRDIAGFTLVLEEPGLDFDQKAITFKQVSLKTPDMMPKTDIALNGVSIGAEGLRIAGGKFSLPRFTTGGGLEFRLSAQIVIDGGSYLIGADGYATVPGAGTFSATASFTNVSKTYPIGLKRALFTYEMCGLGLPIGTTGLYMNKIRGGLAFGPPDELPEAVQKYFDDGTRIQIGVSMIDGQTAGNILRGDVDLWIDITDWDWALRGDVVVLSGLAHSETIASLAGGVFYGSVKVELVFANGQAEIWIWKDGRYVRLAGRANVQFKMEKGSIKEWSVKILWKRFTISIPPFSMTLPGSVGAEFGRFQNGSEGVKGYVSVPCWGTVGAFVSKSGRISIGNVSQYTLYTPTGRSSNLAASRTSLSSARQGQLRSVVYNDQTVPGTASSETLSFRVPTASSGTTRAASTRNASTRSASLVGTLGEEDQSSSEESALPEGSAASEAERIVFVLGYTECDPRLIAIAPSGKTYAEGDSDVIVERTEWGLQMAVLSAESGEWGVRVENIPEDLPYELAVFGKTPVPELEVRTPSFIGERVGSGYTVEGVAKTVKPATVEVYLSEGSDTYLGRLAGSAAVGEGGSFSVPVDVSGIPEGEYYVYASVLEDGAEGAARVSYAGGSVFVEHAEPLAAPAAPLVGVEEDGGLSVRFEDPNGARTAGHYLYVESGSETEKLDIGPVNTVNYPAVSVGTTYAISVSSYDAQRREGARSASSSVTVGAQTTAYNAFALASAELDLSLVSGESVESSIAYTVASPVVRGDANDRMVARVVSAPDWLSFIPEEDGYDLSSGGGSAAFTVSSWSAPAAGRYEAVVAFENLGNREVRQGLKVVIEVVYPAPSISGISPQSVYRDAEEAVIVSGGGFIAGTKVLLDGVECTGATVAPAAIRFVPASGLSGGDHTVTVTGPGGSASTMLAVLAPYYRTVFAASQASVMAGESCSYPFTVEGENGYSGTAAVSAVSLPSGWTFSSPSVSSGESGAIEVSVPADAQSGAYSLSFVTDQGDRITLGAEVTASPPTPTILSLSKYALISGDEVTIYGFGFGSAGTAYLGDTALQAASWAPQMIKAIIPSGAVSGLVTVESDGIRSEGVSVVIVNEGFSLYPALTELDLEGGETGTVAIDVAGINRPVDLSAACDDQRMHASFASAQITPNGKAQLVVSADQDIENGLYPIRVNAVSGTVTRQVVITVRVGDAFEIATGELPSAMESCAYRAVLESRNGSDPVAWSLSEGKLPLGLVLKSDGTIQGSASGIGKKQFTVSATDERGRKVEKKLSIEVEENAWTQEGKDGSRNGYNPVSVPSVERQAWTSAVSAPAGAARLLTGAQRVFAYGSGGLAAYEIKTGKQVFRLEDGSIAKAAYSDDNLYILSGGKLSVRDASYGGERWSVDNAAAFALDGGLLYVSDGGATSAYRCTDSSLGVAGSLVQAYAAGFGSDDFVFFAGGVLHRMNGKALESLVSAGWKTVYEADAELKAAAYESERVVLASSSEAIELDGSYAVVNRFPIGSVNEALLVSPSEIVASGPLGTTIADRASGTVRTEASAIGRLALGREKLVAATSGGLSVLNVYRGSVIWKTDADTLDAVIANERVYALAADRSVRCYYGAENARPPETSITLAPAAPDGSNGWYAVQPELTLPAIDAETYAAETVYRLGDGAWTAYSGAITLPEGEYPIRTRSSDNLGYVEGEKFLNVKVDASIPTARHEAAYTAGNPGWSLGEARLALFAEDAVSGVEAVEYRINGGEWTEYFSELSFPDNGLWSVEYRSRDRAGHLSQVGSWSVSVDLLPPETAATTYREAGLGVVYLEATDDSSGVQRIEYRVDSGETMIYGDPVAIAAGTHAVAYRAIDFAGRAEEWRTLTIEVPPYVTGRLVRDLRFPHYKPGRKLVKNARVGYPLYGDDRHRENSIDALPEYVLGADQIRLSAEDRWSRDGTLCRFTAGDDLIVYYFKHAESRADMTGWTAIAERYPVENQRYFVGGAAIYERRYLKDERVSIPGPTAERNGKANAPLVFVQKSASEAVSITGPAIETRFPPYAPVRFAGTTLAPAAAGSSFSWSARLSPDAESEAVELPLASDGGLGGANGELSYVGGRGTLTVRLELLDSGGRRLAATERSWSVENKANAELYDPAPGTVLAGGNGYALNYKAYDYLGRETTAHEWQISRDGTTWTKVTLSGGALTVPAEAGALYLKARWYEGCADESGQARVRERTWRFEVGAAETPIALSFGGERAGEETINGDEFGPKPSGKEAGFSSDHNDRVRSFRAVRSRNEAGRGHDRRRNDERTEYYISLKKDEKFSVKTGTGRIKATLVLGPYWRSGSYEILVEGKRAVIEKRRQDEEVWEVELETTVEDGVLDITGTADIPLIEATFEKLGVDALPVETAVREREDFRVLEHDKPWEREEHHNDDRREDHDEWDIWSREWDY